MYWSSMMSCTWGNHRLLSHSEETKIKNLLEMSAKKLCQSNRSVPLLRIDKRKVSTDLRNGSSWENDQSQFLENEVIEKKVEQIFIEKIKHFKDALMHLSCYPLSNVWDFMESFQMDFFSTFLQSWFMKEWPLKMK